MVLDPGARRALPGRGRPGRLRGDALRDRGRADAGAGRTGAGYTGGATTSFASSVSYAYANRQAGVLRFIRNLVIGRASRATGAGGSVPAGGPPFHGRRSEGCRSRGRRCRRRPTAPPDASVRAGGEARQRLAVHAVAHPLGLRPRADRLVEVDGRLVPVQHAPFEAAAAFLDRDPRQMAQQALAGADAATGGRDRSSRYSPFLACQVE